ncbi:hypothetical protein GW17_00058053 [Ensete ventricosum]|nr:hypothetical protein GW17_00058053 [Ensete ventricosum]
MVSPCHKQRMVNLKLVHGLPKMGGGRPSSAAPAPVQPAIVPSSPPEVQEISSEEVTKKVVEASGEGSKSQAAKCKGLGSPIDEAPTPRARLKSVRELCNARPGVDRRDYHVIQVSNLPEQDPMTP